MKTFKSAACLERVRGGPLHDTLRELLLPIVCPHAHREYRPEEDGYLILIEPGDVDRVLNDLDVPYRLSEMPFEVVSRIRGVVKRFQNFFWNCVNIDFWVRTKIHLPRTLGVNSDTRIPASKVLQSPHRIRD